MKIVILDFTGAQVFVANYPSGIEDTETFIEELDDKHKLGIRPSNCQWLIVPEDIPLNITHL
jgi:hypothetical protein